VSLVGGALACLPDGGAIVQLREKDLDGRELAQLARSVLAVTRPRSVPLLINDRIDVALAVGADGVHLPTNSFSIQEARSLLGPERLIGVSTHSAAEARAAGDADVVVLGPVWATPGKESPIGVDELARASATNVYAIGGIDSPERARSAIAAGAYGIAGIRGFAQADTVKAMFDILSE